MADFFTHFQQRIQQNPALVSKTPTAERTLTFSEAETCDFARWRTEQKTDAMLCWWRKQVGLLNTAPAAMHESLRFTVQDAAKTWRFEPSFTPFSERSVRCFFRHLMTRFEAHHYTLAAAKCRIYERGVFQETSWRCVFRSAVGTNMGNTEGGYIFERIVLELVFKNDRVALLRVTSYAPNSDVPHSSDSFQAFLMRILGQ